MSSQDIVSKLMFGMMLDAHASRISFFASLIAWHVLNFMCLEMDQKLDPIDTHYINVYGDLSLP